MSEGRVEDLYRRLKERAVNFGFRPGERLNEVQLARDLDASRTPLREALNRLAAEQLVDFQPGRGFFCRDLDARSIFDLYDLREAIETAAVRRACERADEAEIAAVQADLIAHGLDHAGRTIREATAQDEAFHLALARLSGNAEFVRQLGQLNERIRFIRFVDMAARVRESRGEHRRVMEAVRARDADLAAEILSRHIVRRMDQVVAAVKEGYASIYVSRPEDLLDRRIAPGEDRE